MAAATSLTVGASSEAAPPPTASKYVVTIDVSVTPYSYTYPTANGTASAYKLPVNRGDTVAFVARTPKGSKHFAAVIFLSESPLVDSSGRPVPAILWPEHNPPQPLTVDLEAAGTYEYRIVVFDRETETPYTEDSKIIVGGGTMRTADLVRQLHEVAEACPQERKRIEAIEQDLVQLLK